MISCSFAIEVLRSFRVTALCSFIYCLDSACMRNSTPPIFFFRKILIYVLCTRNGETLDICMKIFDTGKICF